MTALEVVASYREDILACAQRHGARDVQLFGSAARGQADADSDIDLLVDMEPGRSLFDMGALQYELEELLGCSVDVVSRAGLRDRIRDRVLQEARPL